MGTTPTLLFLHGVGTGDPDGNWKARLADTLVKVGYPDLREVQVISPNYSHLLKDANGSESLPKVTLKRLNADDAKTNRREFERRIGAIEFRLGRQDHGDGVGGDIVGDFALGTPFFTQARNYLRNADVRAKVLRQILGDLPNSGAIVLVGHSLGSVIAADLLRHLPSGIDVVGMVTIGSPLASETFGVDRLREALEEPPTNLAWWVSFWNGLDPVAARRGVSSAFPWMLDFRVETNGMNPRSAHLAVEYFSRDVVAEAIGFALFGSRAKALRPVETGVDVDLNTAETFALLGLRYAQLISHRLEEDQRERYSGALRTVQANVVETLKLNNDVLNDGSKLPHRVLPFAVARLGFDLSDPDAERPAPEPARYLSKSQAVVPLAVIASQNIIMPFEIAVSKEVSLAAMADLTAEMALTSQFGTDLFEAMKEAREALNDAQMGKLLRKWAPLGAGAIALVIATGGLALAAGAGLAGGAAIVSALAAFGPGGMVGGLLTAGTLMTVGGGGIAFALASPATSAETFEAVLSRQLTAVALRRRQRLEQDPGVWRNIVETEMEVRRSLERLDEFSDQSAPALKDLKRKIVSIERALAYLRRHGLEPGQQNSENDARPDEVESPWYRRAIPTLGADRQP